MTATWFVVMLPGDYPEASELYGPFQRCERAEKVRDDWNANHAADRAYVMPVRPPSQIRGL